VDVLKKARIGLMICDEGHRLKSAGAKTTKALRELETERRVILSGTPIQNELSEFHAMVDFVNPGILDSYSSFKKYIFF
jgi:DNA repair and recombination protein RAD54B